MKFNMNTVLLDLNGKPLDNNGVTLTLKVVSIESLMAVTQSDTTMSGEEKFSLYTLATKINTDDEVDLLPEEVATLKKRIGLCYSPLVVGPAFKLLNG